ncbi:MAG: M28 family peptidase [Chloroflexi bacterium]|nr:M28 family peptidase [Chloroflexota bacterium]
MIDPLTQENHLIGEVWTSPYLYRNLETLCDLGSRFGGTLSEMQAREFIFQQFNNYGLSGVHLEDFEFLSWQRGECRLKTISPMEREIPAIALVYSPPTNEAGLEAYLIDVGAGSDEDYQARLAQLPDGFAMAHSGPDRRGDWLHRREKYGIAVSSGARAFIFVNHQPGMLPQTGSLRMGQMAPIPAVGIAFEHGTWLSREAQQYPVRLRLEVHTSSKPARTAHVVGEVPGNPGDEIILAGAHYDGHDISQGATDNGAGTALVMELVRIFAPLQGQLRRTIRFVCFAVEELGVLGSTQYVEAHQDDLENVALMLNFDSGVDAGQRGFDCNGFEETAHLFSLFSNEMGYPLRCTQRIAIAADNFPFLMAGIPNANQTAQVNPRDHSRGWGHTAADTLDKVSEQELRESAMVAARMLLRCANYPEKLGLRRSPEEVRSMLIEQNLKASLIAQGKWPFSY